MADRIYRNVGEGGKVTLTDQAPRGQKVSNPALDELDALLAATSGDAALARKAQWTKLPGEGPAPSLQPAREALKSSGSLQQLLDLLDREQNPYASDIPTAEEGELLDQSTFGGVMRRALDTAAIPASLLPSPLQPIAAGYQAVRGVQQAVQDPSLVNIGMAGLMAAPVAGSVRRFMSNVPKPTGMGAKGPFSPLSARPQAAAPATAPAASGGNMRRMGMLPFDEGAAAAPQAPASMAAVEQSVPQTLESTVQQALEEMGVNLKGIPKGKGPQGSVRKPAVGPRPKGQSPIQRGEATLFPPKLGGRSGDLHEAQTTGGMFGFDDLPELPEAELARMSRRF